MPHQANGASTLTRRLQNGDVQRYIIAVVAGMFLGLLFP
mgnify:CR=1 FL=1